MYQHHHFNRRKKLKKMFWWWKPKLTEILILSLKTFNQEIRYYSKLNLTSKWYQRLWAWLDCKENIIQCWKYVLSLRRCRQSGQAVGKPTDLVRLELTTMPFAGICPYWTSRLSCHLVELEVSSCLIHYCQLRVIQLVSLVCWRPPTTTPTEMWTFLQGNASACITLENH